MPEQHISGELEDFSWSQLYRSRRGIRKRFTSVWKLPIVKKVMDVLKIELGDDDLILDIGSCDRHLLDKLKEVSPGVRYKSMDIDRKNFHDYYDLDEIDQQFDVVCMFECIEHLSLETGSQTLKRMQEVLKPGGRLYISTPNTFHPNRYWECTHQVPFRYDELGGFVEICGFKVKQIYRVYNDTFVGRLLRIYIMQPLHRYLDIDFAKSILIEAIKIEPSNDNTSES